MITSDTPTPSVVTRIYISGPCSGRPNRNADGFNAAAAFLRSTTGTNYDVVNPAELLGKYDANTRGNLSQAVIRAALRSMLLCDALYLLPEWTHSEGSRLEWTLATRLGMTVIYGRDLPATPLATDTPATHWGINNANHS